MTRVVRSALVPHAPARMFELVDDIASYPDYLPWCRGSEELERDEEGVVARLHVSWAGVKHSFSTRNRLVEPETIEMRLVDGPFSLLEGRWSFTPVGEGCRVGLELDFEFSNAVVSAAFGPVFRHIADTMVDSFTRRAAEIDGNG